MFPWKLCMRNERGLVKEPSAWDLNSRCTVYLKHTNKKKKKWRYFNCGVFYSLMWKIDIAGIFSSVHQGLFFLRPLIFTDF